MEELTSANCPYCGAVVSFTSYFCQNCGKLLRIKPPSTSILRQIIIYSISFFLPPFGLRYAFSYLRQNDDKSKAIGIVTILLTLISIMVTVIVFVGMFNAVTKSLNNPTGVTSGSGLENMLNQQLNNQLKQYKDVGL